MTFCLEGTGQRGSEGRWACSSLGTGGLSPVHRNLEGSQPPAPALGSGSSGVGRLSLLFGYPFFFLILTQGYVY